MAPKGGSGGASHYVNILLPLGAAEPAEDPAARVPSSPFSSCLVQPTRELARTAMLLM